MSTTTSPEHPETISLHGGTYNLFAHALPQYGIEHIDDILADTDQALAAARAG
jgi:O-acetylhomoserine/O-acetylserine sulfhydrylase-like pyridoxal-dependent enzyme